jgi:RNA polymerase sigma-70 factor (ECF subfamily)
MPHASSHARGGDDVVSRAADSPVEALRAARAGREGALDELLAAYRPLLRFLAGKALRGAMRAKADASDVAQDVLLKAHLGFGRFRGTTEAELVVWLKRILSRQLADLGRRYGANQGRNLGREEPLDALGSASPGIAAVASGTSPSAGAYRSEREGRLARALSRLDEMDREIVLLRSAQDLEWAEIGRITDRSPDAARMQWSRAIARLGRILKEQP